jgi:perosamine synthetase
MDIELELEPASQRHVTEEAWRIPVAAPVLAGNEKQYVADCLESGWISSAGKYLELFETAFAKFCGVRHAVACSNGTAALHLALLALGVEQGDEVIVPTLTFVATVNAVTYCGARPVFVDSEPRTWNLDPTLVQQKITPRTKGIIAVHLYGNPADMFALRAIADRHGLFLLEDAAEAHGALHQGRRVGSLGDVAAFSFYGNKIISTGEGGMVVTNDDSLFERVRLLRGQGMDPNQRYWFPVVGYNYRMTNISAAIGLAQIEQAEWHIGRRREVAENYLRCLEGVSTLRYQVESELVQHAYWMFTVILNDEVLLSRDAVMAKLAAQGIETRPVFYPAHLFPPYRDLAHGDDFPVAEALSQRGLSLPTWAGLSATDVRYVCEQLSTSLSVPGELS